MSSTGVGEGDVEDRRAVRVGREARGERPRGRVDTRGRKPRGQGLGFRV